jgi:hypothetical protein
MQLLRILLSTILIASLWSCNEAETKKDKLKATSMSEETATDASAEMKQELKRIAEDTSNINLWHLNKIRAQAMDHQLQNISDPSQKLSLLFKVSIEWLNAGDYEKSLERLNEIFSLLQQQNLRLPPEADYKMKELLGVVNLRKAEIENCLNNHNAFSCIMPIQKAGQHQLRSGSENALKIFRELLQTEKPTAQTKWLYNLAHMTLGSYPSGVENEFVIDPTLFDSDVNFPRFGEVAMSTGIAVDDISGSVVMDDFNNDGYLDLMVSSYGLDDQLRCFENNKKGGFDDYTDKSGLTGLLSGLNMVQADYNNDGWVDVLVLRGAWLGKDGTHPNSLLHNNGDGTFSDVTKESGLYCRYPTQTASWADYNNDGWIDLFIGNEHSDNISAPSQLYENNGNGTFTEVATTKNVAISGFIKGCVWGDYNNDGYPDLYISMINDINLLLENTGPSGAYTFVDKTAQTKTGGPRMSFPCWFFDYNQDGWEDIFVSGFDFTQFETAAGEVAKDMLGQEVSAVLPKLYHNNGDGTFSDKTSEMDIDKVLFTMGCNYGDLNNDGYPDFYAATGTPDFRALIPNKMYLNGQGKTFYDVTTAGGFGHLQKGHGVAFGDLDNDGDQDVYTVLGGSYDGDNFMNALFLNPGHNNAWIKLKLIGTTSNRSAIGARVTITASNDEGQSRNFFQVVSSGASFGANPLLIEQGLGNYNKIQSITIRWPGQQKSQQITGLEPNAYYELTQGSSSPTKISLQSITLHSGHQGHHN